MHLVTACLKGSMAMIYASIDSEQDVVVDPIENALVINTDSGEVVKEYWPNVLYYRVTSIDADLLEGFGDL